MGVEPILIVDDDHAVIDTVRDYLTHEGHAVVTATTGAEGLVRLSEGPVGLVLVDLQLPDMDGTQMMRAAQRLAAPPEVIIVTGHATVDSAIQAVEDPSQEVARFSRPVRMKAI